MKNKLGEATLQPIDEAVPFIVETDTSNFTIAAILSTNRKLVAFHARTFSRTEQRHSALEKEASAVVKALRKWKCLLLGKHLTLITDQSIVSFMHDVRHASKIKNDKILQWRLELAAFDFTIIYRPGKLNFALHYFRICVISIFNGVLAKSVNIWILYFCKICYF